MLHQLFRFVRNLRVPDSTPDLEYDSLPHTPGLSTGTKRKAGGGGGGGAGVGPAKARKNRPMNKAEQEQQIENIRKQLKEFQQPGSAESGGPSGESRYFVLGSSGSGSGSG